MLVRILTAVVGLPLLLAIVLLLPPIGTAVLFALACMIAAYEMLWRTKLWQNKRAVCFTALMAGAVLLWSWAKGCGILDSEKLWLCTLAGIFLFGTALFCELLAGHGKIKVQAIAAVLFAVVFAAALVVFLTSGILMFAAFTVTFGSSDLASAFFGVAFTILVSPPLCPIRMMFLTAFASISFSILSSLWTSIPID